ncbi:MAG: helix-turn-helix domain-containing protein [Myxococcales bacterium]|jgi:XRE family aerobic/anaerobic benzoate catabolism transcriptional regulator|nr:helix-turn-helix domain-containing protein [Myxococcales bacterium]MBK7190961.1 helix-turn-helix domain-containing protein [Myxococcales bacterium]MBP6848835.1 helix-turn-helix domain-containing protein [Kofleriaceae bacterium]
MTTPSPRPLLTQVGARVRAARDELGLSRRQLAEACGVSERFLAQLEGGTGNISLARFAAVADALSTTPAELLAGLVADRRRPAIALLGVRGAGKSTVGRELAKRWKVPFVEVDQEIERAAGLRLNQIFELHGEAYYRRVEREVLRKLLARRVRTVLATGGSIVSDDGNYALLRARCQTVWLKARAIDHWERVVAQGDRRPMAEKPHAFAELEQLLVARADRYALADHTIDTSHRNPTAVVDELAALA